MSYTSVSPKPKNSVAGSGISTAASTITPAAPERPVECTICGRKFKNIPALNGHMRLHGGYYKKDADGRRIIPQGGHLRPLLEEPVTGSRKRKHEKPGNNNTINVGDQDVDFKYRPNESSPSSPANKKLFLENESSGQSESAPATFRCLPPPDTTQLLANLERKTKEEQQAAVAAVAAAAVQLPTPPPPSPAPALAPLAPFSVSVRI